MDINNKFHAFFKPKRVSKLGDSLQKTVEKKFLWKAIDAGRVGGAYKELSAKMKELDGSQMVSWKDSILKIKVNSSVQRQEIILKQAKILTELGKVGVKAREIKVVY